MVWFIVGLCLVLVAVALVVLWAISERDLAGGVLMSLLAVVVGGPVCFGLACLGCALTGGLWPNYSEGVREGYVNKCSVKGAIWKTREGEMQIGSGSQAALQAPWSFSVTDADVWAQIQACTGKRVALKYREWGIMPFRLGETSIEVTAVEAKDVAEKD